MTFLFALALSLGSVHWTPAPAPGAGLDLHSGELSVDVEALHAALSLSEESRPAALDELGEILERGLSFGNLQVGLEGTPSGPFIGNFYYANEIRFRNVDPESVASSLMVRVSVGLD